MAQYGSDAGVRFGGEMRAGGSQNVSNAIRIERTCYLLRTYRVRRTQGLFLCNPIDG